MHNRTEVYRVLYIILYHIEMRLRREFYVPIGFKRYAVFGKNKK